MQNSIKRFFVIVCSMFSGHMFAELSSRQNDFDYIFYGNFKPETYYGRNISLLNNNNLWDKIWFTRQTLDLSLDVLFGREKYCEVAAQFFCTIRNKTVWGNPNSIAQTTESESKLLNSVGRPHKHAIPRNIFWIREAWLWIDLNRLFGLDLDNKHSFTIGAFPFELGRGIALGSAYAVGPELLGFYSDAAVDQHAFGARVTGYILPEKFSYDVYTAILQNKCGSLTDTGETIYGQEYGRLLDPQRGFGHVNFLVAGRLDWHIFDNDKYGKLNIEPYGLFNHDPEQTVEYRADASSKLGTVGFALEYYGPKFEFGFDYAKNFGQQRVKGWDRNQIMLGNLNGAVVEQNNKVVDQNGQNILFVGTNVPQQQIIYGSYRSESENGQKIGEFQLANGDTLDLINKNDRFRNPYTNKYEGWMFVMDAGYWLYKRDLELAVTAGLASGDDNPNVVNRDGIYSGFIGLQEIYSGKRVRSAFVLGGAGKLKRPLSNPPIETAPNAFASSVDGFTNLVFTGAALHWIPHTLCAPLTVNPNVMAYWQEKPSNKFDAQLGVPLEQNARTFLGLEVNVFVDYSVIEHVRVYFVGSVFFPGSHYTDVKGLPLNQDQLNALNRAERTGFDNRIPNLGCDAAYTVNFGVNFKF